MLAHEAVGLDLSLTSTGVAIGDETYGINTKNTDGPTRLLRIRSEIAEIFQDHQAINKKTLVAVEGYSFASRHSHAHSLGEVGGVVRLWLYEQGIRYVVIAPMARAKFATGRGTASKAEVISAVSARTGLLWAGKGAEDKCDAWVLQEMVLTNYGNPRHDWPVVNREALVKVEWPEEA